MLTRTGIEGENQRNSGMGQRLERSANTTAKKSLTRLHGN